MGAQHREARERDGVSPSIPGGGYGVHIQCSREGQAFGFQMLCDVLGMAHWTARQPALKVTGRGKGRAEGTASAVTTKAAVSLLNRKGVLGWVSALPGPPPRDTHTHVHTTHTASIPEARKRARFSPPVGATIGK